MNGVSRNAPGGSRVHTRESPFPRPTAAADVLLPERDFYWTLIDGAPVGDPNAAAARMSLDEDFEKDLPEPFEGLVIRYAPLANAVVGCAMRAERVRAALDAGAVILRPKDLPSAIRERAGSHASHVLRQLNFLVDEFEPESITALHIARRRLMLAGVAATLAMIASGLWLRSNGLDRRADQNTALASEALRSALPIGDEGISPDAARLRLQQELRHLERARGAEAEKARLRDATDGLASLLVAWPKDMETRVSSLQIAATQITLNVEVPDAAAAEALTAALRSVNGWSLQPPRTEIASGHARVNAILRPKREPETPATTRITDREERS